MELNMVSCYETGTFGQSIFPAARNRLRIGSTPVVKSSERTAAPMVLTMRFYWSGASLLALITQGRSPPSPMGLAQQETLWELKGIPAEFCTASCCGQAILVRLISQVR